MLHAIRLTACPALECESSSGVRPIYEDEHREVYRRLEAVASGNSYEYYHCRRWCKRLWRVRQVELGSFYEEPEFIGSWEDDTAAPTLHVYDAPRPVSLQYTYRRSLSDPSRPARNKTDATRRRR